MVFRIEGIYFDDHAYGKFGARGVDGLWLWRFWQQQTDRSGDGRGDLQGESCGDAIVTLAIADSPPPAFGTTDAQGKAVMTTYNPGDGA